MHSSEPKVYFIGSIKFLLLFLFKNFSRKVNKSHRNKDEFSEGKELKKEKIPWIFVESWGENRTWTDIHKLCRFKHYLLCYLTLNYQVRKDLNLQSLSLKPNILALKLLTRTRLTGIEPVFLAWQAKVLPSKL